MWPCPLWAQRSPSGHHAPSDARGTPFSARRCGRRGRGRHAEGGFACPLSQHLLGDSLGLTAVDVNRILRRLRERGLMTLQGGQVVIHDLAGLKSLAGYDSSYLDRNGPLPS